MYSSAVVDWAKTQLESFPSTQYTEINRLANHKLEIRNQTVLKILRNLKNDSLLTGVIAKSMQRLKDLTP